MKRKRETAVMPQTELENGPILDGVDDLPGEPDPVPPPAPPAAPSAAPLPPVAQLLPDHRPDPALDERLRRLEEMLTRLHAPRPAPVGNESSVSPTPSLQKSKTFWADLRKRLAASSGPVAELKPAAAPPPSLVPAAVRRTWLLMDVVAELRAIHRMFVDPRYRMSLFGWLTPLLLAAAFVTSSYWLPMAGIPVVGPFLDKLVDLGLGFILFKVLGHEARRYRETAPDLPGNLRL
jgi:hypothetical protein